MRHWQLHCIVPGEPLPEPTPGGPGGGPPLPEPPVGGLPLPEPPTGGLPLPEPPVGGPPLPEPPGGGLPLPEPPGGGLPDPPIGGPPLPEPPTGAGPLPELTGDAVETAALRSLAPFFVTTKLMVKTVPESDVTSPVNLTVFLGLLQTTFDFFMSTLLPL